MELRKLITGWLVVLLPFWVQAQGLGSGTDYALIFGVADYEAKSLKLNYADNDAFLFKQFLVTNPFFTIEDEAEQIVFKVNEEVTRQSVTFHLRDIYDKADSGDRVLIYFSGHGDIDDFFEEPWILTYNVSDQREYAAGGALELKYLTTTASKLADKGVEVWLVLDACKSGNVVNSVGASTAIYKLGRNLDKIITFYSSKSDKPSHEFNDIQQGVFTYYLYLGLMGMADGADIEDGQITAYELNQYMKNKIRSFVRARGKEQQPEIRSVNDEHILSFVDLTTKEQALAKVEQGQLLNPEALLALNKDLDADEPALTSLSEQEIQWMDAFNTALQEKKLLGEKSAQSTYEHALKQLGAQNPLVAIMRFKLYEKLNIHSQKLINKYLQGKHALPSSSEFSKSADYLTYALTLIDTSDFEFDNLRARQLFLKGYTVVRAERWKQYREAEAWLLEADRLQPNSAYIHHALGMLFYGKRDYNKAAAYYRNAIEWNASWKFPRNGLGNVYSALNKWDQALAQYDKVLEMDSTYEASVNNKAIIMADLGRYNEAEQLYRHAQKLDPKSPYPVSNLGNVFEQRGMSEKAMEQYKRAIELDSTFVQAYYNLAELYMNSRSDGFDLEAGHQLLRSAIQIEPYYGRGYAEMGDYFRFNAKDTNKLDSAVYYYNKAIELAPLYAWGYAARGYAFKAMMKPEEALASFKAGVNEIPSSAPPHYYLARFYESLDEDTLAEEHYLKALEINPSYLFATKNLGNLYERQKEYDKSEELYQSYLQNQGQSPVLIKGLGDFYLRQHDTVNAIKYYQKSKEIDPSYTYSYTGLAYVYAQVNRFEEAATNFEVADSLAPGKFDRQEFYRQLEGSAVNNFNRQQYSIALEGLEVVAENIGLSEVAFPMTKAYYMTERNEAALNTILTWHSESTLSKSDQLVYNELLAKIYIALGQYAEAEKHYQLYIESEIDPSYLLGAIISAKMGKQAEAKELYDKEKKYNSYLMTSSFLKKNYNPSFITLLNKLKQTWDNE